MNKNNKNKTLILSVATVLVLVGVVFAVSQALRSSEPDNSVTEQHETSVDSDQNNEQFSSKDEVDNQNSQDTSSNPLPEGSTVEPPSLNLDESSGFTIPVETNHFSITGSDNNYEVELFAIINRPEQYDDYLKQLTEYKQEALDYMQNAGVNVSDSSIQFIPELAQDL